MFASADGRTPTAYLCWAGPSAAALSPKPKRRARYFPISVLFPRYQILCRIPIFVLFVLFSNRSRFFTKKNPEPLSSWYSTSGVYLCLFIDAEHLYIRRLPTLNASPRYLFGPSKTRGGNLYEKVRSENLFFFLGR